MPSVVLKESLIWGRPVCSHGLSSKSMFETNDLAVKLKMFQNGKVEVSKLSRVTLPLYMIFIKRGEVPNLFNID